MNLEKILCITAKLTTMKPKVALLIIACVIVTSIFSAGCTISSSIIQDDKPADVWTNVESGGKEAQIIYFYEDGTGKKDKTNLGIVTESRRFTWERAGPYYTIIFKDDDDVDTFTTDKGTLVHDNHYYTKEKTVLPANTTEEPKQDTQICGTWTYNGLDTTKTLVINEDGTGYRIKEKNKAKIAPFTWKKTGSRYYTLFFEGGEDDTVTYSNGKLNCDGEIYTKE